jgi:enolase-phosphatase E1
VLGAELHPPPPALISSQVHAILLDIEGTTTPIAFVQQVLFPYARARVADFLARHLADAGVRADVTLLRAEHAAEPADSGRPEWNAADDQGSATAFVYWLMDRDSKSTGLKSLQGKIWEEGYRNGHLKGKGEVYADVRPALERWHARGQKIAIFSSGSVQAQRNLFANTIAGDLTPFLTAYFDTTTGPKRQPASYRRIAELLNEPPKTVVFVSDVTAELDAAGAAGMRTVLSVRPGNAAAAPSFHARIQSFDELP